MDRFSFEEGLILTSMNAGPRCRKERSVVKNVFSLLKKIGKEC